MTELNITVIGAGISGLWQALTLAGHGHAVRLIEQSPADNPFANAASWFAAGMLAPYCESEAAEPLVTKLGIASFALWRAVYPQVQFRGTLVVAAARDRAELDRFARLTSGQTQIDSGAIAELEPDLAERFTRGLYFADEAHMCSRAALQALLAECERRGVVRHHQTIDDGDTIGADAGSWIIDCRGQGAKHQLDGLRGVRGEMVILETSEIQLQRTVRLLHPRFPLYIVPWGQGRYMIGSTVIESDDDGPVTARSVLDLLGAAYAVHPAFGEARILELGAGVRPAFADNVPKIVIDGQRLYVNGMYRHGFLTAPALAEMVADFIVGGEQDPEIFVEHRGEWRGP